MKKILLLLLLINVSYADDFRVGEVDQSYKVLKKQEKFLDRVSVIKKDKTLLNYEADLVTQKLLKYGLVKFKSKKSPYLVTVWTGGAHGQELIIFDLEKFKEKDKEASIAYLYSSAWTIHLDINQERIVIKGKRQKDEKELVPANEELTFKP